MKVTELYSSLEGKRPLVAADVSPPRSADAGSLVEAVQGIGADLYCVAYSPGRAVRLGSVAAAVLLERWTATPVIFNLATRDMNKLAIQMHLLEAQALGLQNVLVLRGDAFTDRDIGLVQTVQDYTPTDLVKAIGEMNEGRDFRGSPLSRPTDLCAGAAIEFGRLLQAEVALTHRKAQAGAQFFVVQSVFGGDAVREFGQRYTEMAGKPLAGPVLFGVQVFIKGGVKFGNTPEGICADLERGRSGIEIAVETASQLWESGARAFYIIAPIMKGGARDYDAAAQALAEIRRLG